MKLRWIKRMENNPVTEGYVSCKSSDEKCPGQQADLFVGLGEGTAVG